MNTCETCEKTFKRKNQLETHKKRKRPCKKSDEDTIRRLNYIGSKFQLLDWISDSMKAVTGWSTFEGRRIADLFSGTGAVSHYFRTCKALVVANDAELYSSVITRAFTCSVITPACERFIAEMATEIAAGAHSSTVGFITDKYSPHGADDRKFFTVENARRIDYIRTRIDEQTELTENEHAFLLASLLTSADAVSNVPAVYGCYLQKFKDKATKPLVLEPVHTSTELPVDGSRVHCSDVLSPTLLESIDADAVYLDPPYNQRQYSKNYFPLNMIALTPEQQGLEDPLKGKTGIPASCFISPFCSKSGASGAFEALIGGITSPWIFMSYSSEGLISRDAMVELMGKYGTVTVVERDYKRFKSYEYNKTVPLKEFLFCLERHDLKVPGEH
jgi:adenine-specific DNA-methyltransferase